MNLQRMIHYGQKKVPVKKQALRMASDAAVRASKNNEKHQPFLPMVHYDYNE